MGGLPLATRAGTIGLVIATVGAYAWALGSEPSFSNRDLIVALILGIMIAVAEFSDISFPHAAGTFHVSVGSPIALAAGLTLGPVAGGTVVMLAILIESLYDRRMPIKIVVNVATLGLVTLLSALVYRELADTSLTPLGSFRNMGSVVAASMVFTFVNAAVLALIVSTTTDKTPFQLLRTNLSGVYVELLTLPTFGALVPVLSREHPAAVLAVVIPLVGPLLAFKGFERTHEDIKETMAGLADALERRDPYTHQHSVRVTEYVQMIISQMPNIPASAQEGILAAARIHDLGKVAVPDLVLNKPGSLTPEEYDEIQGHAGVGAEMVKKLSVYRRWTSVIRNHHERWDGAGYPDGLAGEAIPLGARMIAVADAYDAMTTDRVYRKAFPVAKALTELRAQSGIQFDPEIVDALCRALSSPDEEQPPEGGGQPPQPAPPALPVQPIQAAPAPQTPQQPAAAFTQTGNVVPQR